MFCELLCAGCLPIVLSSSLVVTINIIFVGPCRVTVTNSSEKPIRSDLNRTLLDQKNDDDDEDASQLRSALRGVVSLPRRRGRKRRLPRTRRRRRRRRGQQRRGHQADEAALLHLGRARDRQAAGRAEADGGSHRRRCGRRRWEGEDLEPQWGAGPASRAGPQAERGVGAPRRLPGMDVYMHFLFIVCVLG